jgi:hypothetical protein
MPVNKERTPVNRKLKISYVLAGLLLMGSIVGNTADLHAEIHMTNPYSPIKLTFRPDKTVFKVGEPVTGVIILNNTYPATLPGVFYVQLFRGKRLVTQSITSLKVIPAGTTHFSFKEFGISSFNLDERSVGKWRIRISQQNLDDSYAKEVTVRIISK